MCYWLSSSSDQEESGVLTAIRWTNDKFAQSGHSSSWVLLTTRCQLIIPDSFWAKRRECWSLTLSEGRGKNLQKTTPLPRLKPALPLSNKSPRWQHHKTESKRYLLQTSWRSETWKMGWNILTLTYFKQNKQHAQRIRGEKAQGQSKEE